MQQKTVVSWENSKQSISRLDRIRRELNDIERKIAYQLQSAAKEVRSRYDWFPWAAAPITAQNYQWRGKNKRINKMSEPNRVQYALVRTTANWQNAHEIIPFLPSIPADISSRSVAFCVGFGPLDSSITRKRFLRQHLKVISCIVFYDDEQGELNEYSIDALEVPFFSSGIEVLEHRWNDPKFTSRYVRARLSEQPALLDTVGRQVAEALLPKSYLQDVRIDGSIPFDIAVDDDVWRFYVVGRAPQYAHAVSTALHKKAFHWESLANGPDLSEAYWWPVPEHVERKISAMPIGPDLNVVGWNGQQAALLDEGEWVLLASLSPRLQTLCDGLLVQPVAAELIPDMIIQSAVRSALVRFAVSEDGPLACTGRTVSVGLSHLLRETKPVKIHGGSVEA